MLKSWLASSRQKLLSLLTGINEGDTFPVEKWEWVCVKNTAGISNHNCTFPYNDTGGIQEGGCLEVVKLTFTKGILVKYTSPNKKNHGTPLPTGAIFYDSFWRLRKREYAYKEVLRKRQEAKDLVASLQAQAESYPLPPSSMPIYESTWVNVKNIEGISNKNVFFPFDDKGLIHAGGELVPIAVQGTVSLAKYKAPSGKQCAGTALPTGALVLLENDVPARRY